MRYYIIAGEASGDLHGSNLIKGLQAHDAHTTIRFWGGDEMEKVAGKAVKHIRDLAFMGFVEVIKHLPTILKNISFCKKDMLDFRPDVVILIDYPGFNFRLFKFLKQHSFKTIYYISPQLWAWKQSRVKKVREFVDRLYVIFPFEVEFYQKHGITAHYFGHPLLDALEVNKIVAREKIIALLPGSRKQEITYLLPEMVKMAKHFPAYHFVIAGMSTHGQVFYQNLIGDAKVKVEFDSTYALLRKSSAALVTSGTATLETALHFVPQVICYKSNYLSYRIARWLVKGIKFIGIVNLIAGKKIVEELIQQDVNETRLKAELAAILDSPMRATILKDYDELVEKLGNSGSSGRVAEDMVGWMRSL
jgi:lipid-A-disaccharide synthase